PQDVRYRIVGSGPVALACALFLVRAGIDPSRLHLQLPSPLDSSDQPPAPVGGSARRMLALSDGSRQLLRRIIALPPGGTIERIEITMSGRSGRTRIAARDFNIDALGHVIPYPDLVEALRAAAARLAFALPPHTESSSTRWLTIHAAGMPRPSQ